MTLSQMLTSIDDIYGAALQKFQENPMVQRCESEDIKADYQEYLEKAYQEAKVKVEHAFKMQELQKKFEALQIGLKNARQQWQESEKMAKRASEEMEEAKKALKKTLVEQQKLGEESANNQKLLHETEMKRLAVERLEKQAKDAADAAKKDLEHIRDVERSKEKVEVEQSRLNTAVEERIDNIGLGEATVLFGKTIGKTVVGGVTGLFGYFGY
ncbi:uncharacterized protein [Watersipora subatra]|uniref:uncharacterized protein n=1 Tax=Watersipora subatra TaxID=2589382 RepID=UPI00355C8851